MLSKSTAALLFLGAIIQSIFCAEWMDFGNGGKANQEPLQVFSGTNGVHADFYGVKHFQTTADDGLTYDRLEFTGKNGLSMAIGFPQVPLSTFYIEVSSDNPSVIVTPGDYVIYENYNLYPSQKFGEDYVGAPEPEFEKNLEAYGTDKFYPEILAEIKKPLTMRGRKISTVAFYPVQYNPVTKQLKVYTSLDVTVPEATSGPNAKDSYVFDSILKSFVINYESPAVPNQQANMLIITPDEFYEDLLPFKEWKEKLGIKTKIVTRSNLNYLGFNWDADDEPNSTYDHIDGYIKSEYDGPNPPDYLLIVGDTGNDPDPHVPVHYVTRDTDYWYEVGTDFYYSTMDLSDAINEFGLYDLPDIFIGRISAENEDQLQVILYKIMNYEDDPFVNDTDWYEQVLVASYFQDCNYYEDTQVVFSDGYEDRFFVYATESISGMISSQYNINKIYCNKYVGHPMSLPPTYYYNGDPITPGLQFTGATTDVINMINEGTFLVNHRDHGTSGNYYTGLENIGDTKATEGWVHPVFSDGHIDLLCNGEKLPVMFSINCMTGWFDGETDGNSRYDLESLGELLLRKENGGVVSFIGSSRASSSGYNDVLSIGLNSSLFFPTNKTYTQGYVLNSGKMSMYNYYIIPGGRGWFDPPYYSELKNRIQFEGFHLLGDPTMEIRTEIPIKLVLDINYNEDFVVVTNQVGEPQELAKVVFRSSDSYIVKITGADGIASFEEDINYGSEISAVAHNTIPAYNHIVKTDETWTEKDIRGDVIVLPGATLSISGEQMLPRNEKIIVMGTLYLDYTSYLLMQQNSEIIVKAGGRLILDPNSIVQVGEGAKITIQNGVTLTLDGVTINGMDWAGINTEPGSTLYARYCAFTGAETAISGIPAKLSVSNCTFTDCTNGIELTACNDFRIIRNTFTGKGEGTAITVTQSNGWINNNTASNFYKGVNVISCSPLMVQNTITNNVLNGVYTAGYNTYPQMYNPIQEASLKSTGEDLGIDDRELNNTIYNNGISYVPPLGFISRASQLYMVSDSNIYLNEGMNNIYSDGNSVPCIRTLGLIQEGVIPRPILIYAPENYWGSNVNDSFFALSEPYYLDYSNYSTSPYGSLPLTSTGPDNDQASKFLSKALEAELDGKYDKAIKTYERIIEKYPDSSEALVAYAKLPDSYTQESLSIEPLIEIYDMNIAEENSNKKFFKELKVSSHIKAKNYDTAIALSEEMKLEAGTEDEVILCDIDIAIANMLKNSENKGKSRTESITTDISALLDKLTGGEDKGDTADISDAVMPETSRLYQNYPNPFNPVTQIKFDLAKAGNVKLSVYNINGQKVAELLNGVQNAGVHTVEFDGSNLNSGVYYCTLEAAGSSLVQKMVLIK